MNDLHLTDDLVERFNENGFLILEKFLDEDKTKLLGNLIEPLFKGEFETGIEPDEWNWKVGRDPNDVTRQICNAWKSNNLIKKIVCNPKIGELISRLMNWEGVRLLQDNVLWKPPHSRSLMFHQDASYDDWIVPQTMATCWIALDEISDDSGALEYVTGSHKWGLSPPTTNFHAPKNYKKDLEFFAKKNNKPLNIVKVTVPAGGASFHHGHTWHGSGINMTPSHRRALVSHCVPTHAKFHPTNCGGTGRIYRKYKLDGKDELNETFFPTLWEK